jgi:DNA-binding GntR family transcriptional regulator
MVQRIIETSSIVHVQHDAGSPANIRANKKGFRAHRRLVELIEQHDAEGAARLWRKHLDEAETYLLGSNDPVTVLDLLG